MDAFSALLSSQPAPPSMPHERRRNLLLAPTLFVDLAVVFCAYFVAGKLGQATTSIRSSNLGPVWPAYGIALAAFLKYGAAVWPAVTTSAFLVAISAVTPLAALGQSIGATTGALAGALLLRRFPDFDPTLAKLRDALALIVVGAFGSALISSLIGSFSLYATGIQPYRGIGSAWLIYWLGDSTGALLVTPLAFTLVELLQVGSRRRVVELLTLVLLLTGACVVVFGDLPMFPIRLHILAFAVLPFVMWGAISFGIGGASLSLFLIASLATVLTAFGSGPFTENTPFVNAVLLDVVFAVLAVSGLTLAAVIAERKRVQTDRDEQRDVETALSGVNRKLIEAQEEERRRIGRELHDDIGQQLAVLANRMTLVSDGQLASANLTARELRAGMEKLATDVQALSRELHSPRVTLLGIAVSTGLFCSEFARQHGVVVTCDIHDVPDGLNAAASLCLYRVLQEALHNAFKHSGQQRFDVALWGTPGAVHLKVRDHGRGFDLSAARMTAGIGLVTMRERVNLVGGLFTVTSTPQHGTTVLASVPAQS